MPFTIPHPGDLFVAAHVPTPLIVDELHLSTHQHQRDVREYLVTAKDGSRWVLRQLATDADDDAQIRWLGFPATAQRPSP